MILRAARLEDAAGIAHAHVETWASSYLHVLPDPVLSYRDHSFRTGEWLERIGNADFPVLVAIVPGQGVAGFIACRVNGMADPYGFDAQITHLYVLSHMRRRGVGRALLSLGGHELLKAGARSASIWIYRGNSGLDFCMRLGGKLFAERTRPLPDATGRPHDITMDGVGWGRLEDLVTLLMPEPAMKPFAARQTSGCPHVAGRDTNDQGA